MDMNHADSTLIMGSNRAECHPVPFRWVMQAKTRERTPATIIHADPRFTRTSAMANIYAPLRAGSDIVFLGALIRHVLESHEPIFRKDKSQRTPREQFFHDYIVRYTNAATLINEEYSDAEENLTGVFAGFNAEKKEYDPNRGRYGAPKKEAAGARGGKPGEGRPPSFSGQVGKRVAPPPFKDEKLKKKNCVWQILRRH